MTEHNHAKATNLIHGDEPWVLAYNKWMLALYEDPVSGEYWRTVTKNDLLSAFMAGYTAALEDMRA